MASAPPLPVTPGPGFSRGRAPGKLLSAPRLLATPAPDGGREYNRNRRPGPDEVCEVYEATVPDEAAIDEDEDILNYDDLDDPDAYV